MVSGTKFFFYLYSFHCATCTTSACDNALEIRNNPLRRYNIIGDGWI